MTKHSKNNTASSIFSYAEYKKLDYGTKRQRLGNESMRSFNACALCLNTARDPVSCGDGHLFCRECVLTDILTQKTELTREKAKLTALRKELEAERERARAAARERVLREFERGQVGLAVGGPSRSSTSNSSEKKNGDEPRGTKRKSPPPPSDPSSASPSTSSEFKFNPSSRTLLEIQKEAEDEALRQIEKEQAEALKSKLPDFWLPSVLGSYADRGTLVSKGKDGKDKDLKIKVSCRGAGQGAGHVLAMKDLIPVKFTYHNENKEAGKEKEGEPMCPSCKKTLSNNILLYLSKPCGHVSCKTCTETLLKPNEQCVACDGPVKVSEVLELKREGTGFAGGGLAETSRAGIAFQG